MLRRLIAVPAALILPPLGVYVAVGRTSALLAVLVLFLIAQGVFWFMAAGPGVLLWAGTVVLAILVSLFAPARP